MPEADEESLGKVLAGATKVQKDKLMNYRDSHMAFQKYAEALSEQAESLQNEAQLSEGDKFDALHRKTASVTGLFEQLKSLKSEQEKVLAQKKDALEVLRD